MQMRYADDDAFDRLTGLYGKLIKPGARILDLGSSSFSHLPAGVEYERVQGIGMNAAELEKNQRLDSWEVQVSRLRMEVGFVARSALGGRDFLWRNARMHAWCGYLCFGHHTGTQVASPEHAPRPFARVCAYADVCGSMHACWFVAICVHVCAHAWHSHTAPHAHTQP